MEPLDAHKLFLPLVSRKATPYAFIHMIRSFRHKGLKAFYESGDRAKLRADHISRLRRLLAALDAAQRPADLDRFGAHLHPLQGDLKGYWAINVSGNWRLVFRFIGTDVELVDYLDYH